MEKTHKIYMVGTTHFDPVWMWTWDEGMASIRSTFRSALDRMKEDRKFIYSFSSPAVFEWIKKVDPKMFKEIQKRVKQGRWDLVEGWWVQPDCYAASGESYARQGLYGQRYLMENFGKMSKAGFNTDSFGHSAMLPQIYKKSGMDAYVFGRPSLKEKQLPGPMFMWESPDGSRLLAFRCGSDGANSYSQKVRMSIEHLGSKINEIGHDMLMIYGVSNHGGAPTKKAIAEINSVDKDKNKDFDICFSSVEGFCEDQDVDSLPVVSEELLVKAFGVFSNHTEVKKNNRLSEYAMLNAEKFALLANMLTGKEYPAGEMLASWQDVLLNQFHDIIGGASVKPSYFDARNLHGRALQTASEVIHYSLQTITKDIDASGEGFPLVVWNPNNFDVETGVEAELQWAWEFEWYDGDIKVTDSRGKVIPCQIIQELSGLPRFRSRFVFRDTIPSMGYKLYYIHQKSQPKSMSSIMKATKTTMESKRFVVKICQKTGSVKSIFDKKLGRKVMLEAGKPVVREDKGDTWAFNIDEYGKEPGKFKLESAEVIENGPVRSLIRTKSSYNNSYIEQDIILYNDTGTIEGRFRVNWREQRKVLKMCFTTDMKNPKVTSAVPYGAVERPNDGMEVPAGEWLDLSEKDCGVSILTDSVFAYDVKGSTAGLTLLRSAIYAHHGSPGQRFHIDESKDYDHLEQGCREGAWTLVIHDGNWKKAQTPKQAMSFNNPVITIDEANHKGTLPPEDSLIKTATKTTLVTVVKKAEDDDSIILRMYEYAGRKDNVKIKIKPINKEYQFKLSKYEIKTIKLSKKNSYRPIETNILENEL
jgi:alpha-mannosidase